jgi:hypothetical protein
MSLGPDKTFAKLNHYFWFPGMTKFVKKYCDHCLKCIVGKKHTGPKHSLVPVRATTRYQKYGIIVVNRSGLKKSEIE